jgi:hypothetical protein
MLVILMLPLWLAFVCAFFGIIVGLVMRKGRIIRENLHDEVLIGSLSRDELRLICSPVGRLRATLRDGGLGRRFVGCGSRLGLCKWHAARAMKGDKETISTGLIAPLRQELARLRRELHQRHAPRHGRPHAARPVGPPRGYGHDQRFHPHHPQGYAPDQPVHQSDPRYRQDPRGFPQPPNPYPPDPKRVRPPGGRR